MGRCLAAPRRPLAPPEQPHPLLFSLQTVADQLQHAAARQPAVGILFAGGVVNDAAGHLRGRSWPAW